MKKLYLSVTMLLLTAVVLTGCGCRNVAPAATTQPTTMPTIATTQETTAPTTMPAPETTQATVPTIEDGNGPISTDSTESMERSGSNGQGTGNGITGSVTG